MVLEVNNLNKSYRSGFLSQKKEVLKDVTFQVAEGSVVGFIGANGAGKSTTIKSVLGLVKPDSGSIQFFGDKKLNSNVLKDIGFLPERPNFYKFLSGYELLLYYGQLSGHISGPRLKELAVKTLKLVGLFEDKEKLIASYSKGMIQRIGIAQALIHDPKFIILDEPLSGLDPDGRYQLSEIIKSAANSGKTIFFSSHLLDDTQRLCDSIVVIKNGAISFQGGIQDVLQNQTSIYEVSFFKNNKSETKKVNSEEELNHLIKKLVTEKSIITDVSKNSRSLEEAYVNMVSQ